MPIIQIKLTEKQDKILMNYMALKYIKTKKKALPNLIEDYANLLNKGNKKKSKNAIRKMQEM